MSNEVSRSELPLPTFARLGLLSSAVQQMFTSAKPQLAQVETRIRASLSSDASQLTEIASYLQQLGGKRVRPLLTLLSARLFGLATPTPALIDVAAGIELIHMATLLHDDIIDRSSTRRSKPSAYRSYGLTPTLLTGDFLLVRAFGICAHLDTFVIEATEEACVALTEGELLEGKLSPERRLDLSEYEVIVDKKTASLFTLAAKVGAHLAGASSSDIETISSFGRAAGIAFQMIDDILDVVADEDLLGKPAGSDLRQHTPSLLNILWLESGDPAAQEFFSSDESTPEQCHAALITLQQSSLISEARELAREYANAATQALASLSSEVVDQKTKKQLESLVEYTLERCM